MPESSSDNEAAQFDIHCEPLTLQEQKLRFDFRPLPLPLNDPIAIRLTATHGNDRLATLSVTQKPGGTVAFEFHEHNPLVLFNNVEPAWRAVFRHVRHFAESRNASIIHCMLPTDARSTHTALLTRFGFRRSSDICRAGRTVLFRQAVSPAAQISEIALNRFHSRQDVLQDECFRPHRRQDLLTLLTDVMENSTDLSDLPVPAAEDLLAGWAAMDADVRLFIATADSIPAGILATSRQSLFGDPAKHEECNETGAAVPQAVIIEYIGVDPRFRRQHFAAALLNTAIRFHTATADRPAMFTAFVDGGNAAAVQLYQKLHFGVCPFADLLVCRTDSLSVDHSPDDSSGR
ncbi:MAG: GNAT family N-acetyltransferase [Planctomycetaceae bacterium]